ncbi:hypothetical protein [Pleurocapsa sp. PCC 7319]|uniref:hypothetical protein n=1 Tax=Pleurocapsa sp. PCC 7319 TaxID=118161 RepID=UPI000344A2BB|nr:hypothetical protein [Pleurocapsa sp. PCC 7319]
MIDPLFWLGLSLFLVSFSLFAVLLVTIPTLQEVAKAARSAEKLFDTLNREFPPTLEAIRFTGREVGELTDEINQGINNATGIVKQVDQGLVNAKQQAQQVQQSSRGLAAGVKAAWKVWRTPRNKDVKISSQRHKSFQPPISRDESQDN